MTRSTTGRRRYVTPETLDEKACAWLHELRRSRGRTPPDLSDAALVVLDVQRIFVDPTSPAYLPAWPAVEKRVVRLMRAFAARRRPIAFTRHVHQPGDDSNIEHFFGRLLVDGDPLSALAEVITPHRKHGTVFNKSTHAAFAENLPPTLRRVRQIVLVGVQTHLCVLATAIDLARYRIRPTVIVDACAAPTEADHRAAMRVLATGHAHVASCAEALRALKGLPHA
jgi:nicotinamidase-related amidase